MPPTVHAESGSPVHIRFLACCIKVIKGLRCSGATDVSCCRRLSRVCQSTTRPLGSLRTRRDAVEWPRAAGRQRLSTALQPGPARPAVVPSDIDAELAALGTGVSASLAVSTCYKDFGGAYYVAASPRASSVRISARRPATDARVPRSPTERAWRLNADKERHLVRLSMTVAHLCTPACVAIIRVFSRRHTDTYLPQTARRVCWMLTSRMRDISIKNWSSAYNAVSFRAKWNILSWFVNFF